jgi:hypothetical protein
MSEAPSDAATVCERSANDDALWKRQEVAAAVFLLVFVLIQTAVPFILLWTPRPARFGWQMFSVNPQRVRYVLVFRDGTRKAANLSRYVAQSRGEMDLTQSLPQHLCRVVPGIASVEVVRSDTREMRVCMCR